MEKDFIEMILHWVIDGDVSGGFKSFSQAINGQCGLNALPLCPMIDPSIAALRQDYKMASLRRQDVAGKPLEQFRRWFAEAQSAELPEPNAMILGTVDAAGTVSTRTVLMKGMEERGLTFFTNYVSEKGRALAVHPQASLTFLWLTLERQVHLRGRVEQVAEEESDAYFAMRPYASQIGALASMQSAIIESREQLERRFADLAERYPEGAAIPRPAAWGGYRLVPETVEFWQGRRSRLHDRLRYRRQEDQWIIERLCP